MLTADGTGILKVKALGPEADCNLVCVQSAREISGGDVGVQRGG